MRLNAPVRQLVLLSYLCGTLATPLLADPGLGAMGTVSFDAREALTESAPVPNPADVRIGFGYAPASSPEERMEQLKTIVQTHESNGGAPVTDVIITFDPNNPEHVANANKAAEQLGPKYKITGIAIDGSTLDKIAAAGSEDGEVKSAWSRFIPEFPEPKSSEVGMAWFTAGFRLATLIPVLYNDQAPMLSIAGAAGYAVAAVMIGRTYYRNKWLQGFNRLFKGYDPATGKNRYSSRFETVLRFGADLVFFEVLGTLRSINKGAQHSQSETLVLWAVNTGFNTLFSKRLSRRYNTPEEAERAARANFNFWMAMAVWPVLDLYKMTPTLIDMGFARITAAHLSLAVVSVASVMAIQSERYNRFLDIQNRFMESAKEKIAYAVGGTFAKIKNLCDFSRVPIQNAEVKGSTPERLQFDQNVAAGQ